MNAPTEPVPPGESLTATAAWFAAGGIVTAPFSASLAMLTATSLAEVLAVGVVVIKQRQPPVAASWRAARRQPAGVHSKHRRADAAPLAGCWIPTGA